VSLHSLTSLDYFPKTRPLKKGGGYLEGFSILVLRIPVMFGAVDIGTIISSTYESEDDLGIS